MLGPRCSVKSNFRKEEKTRLFPAHTVRMGIHNTKATFLTNFSTRRHIDKKLHGKVKLNCLVSKATFITYWFGIIYPRRILEVEGERKKRGKYFEGLLSSMQLQKH